MSCWSTTTFGQQRPLTLNWPFEKSIATIVIHKLSIRKIHRKQLNTRLLVENRTCKLMIRIKLEPGTLCFHWKYSFPCNFKFLCWPGPPRPSNWPWRRPERRVHRPSRAVTRINLQDLLGTTRIGCVVLSDDELGHQCQWVPAAAYRVPMPWLQTNMALYVRLGAACWVPLHDAHLSLRYASKWSLLLHVDQHYGPLKT